MNGKKIRVRRHLDAWEDFSPEPGRHHVTFEDEDRLLPELSILGWLRFTRAFDHALESDQHAKEFELHYIVNGEKKLSLPLTGMKALHTKNNHFLRETRF